MTATCQWGTSISGTQAAQILGQVEGATVEGEWAGRVTGLGSQCAEIAMMVTPDGHSRLELSRFLTPPVISDHRTAPVNALGYCLALKKLDNLFY